MPTVTYEGTTDHRENQSESVEIDGKLLPKGKPVEVSKEQAKRLEDLPYHRFTVEADRKS